MPIKKVKEDIYWVGTIDWDRRLFDELIPLPDGTSYNSYLIKNQDEALLIDTVDPSKKDEFFQNIKEAKIKKIKYIIAQHAEQDHSGCIPDVLREYPDCKIITNQKCKELLTDELLLKQENFYEIKDEEIFHFGDKTFQFLFSPWVHWPETFLTYLPETKILFTCDFFGSHLATSELWADSKKTYLYRAAKRYYAEIMMPFRQVIKKHLEKLKGLSIDIIAPSHGPIYRNPEYILSAYQEWVSDQVKEEVVIPYISMHGCTQKMVLYLMEQLMKKNIKVTPYHLIYSDVGELAMALVDAATIILASPTVLTGPHPQIVYAAYLCKILKPKARFAGIIGSFGWGSKMEQDLLQMLSNLNVELLPSVIVKSYPTKDDFLKLGQLAEKIASSHAKLKE
ncbi:MAG: FprA family A-type flavoprotein [Candidatus Atribacteria bacterium]|nr:FprA family A-type flavoprotein [Candidatus Atribacteria bacterium]